MVPGSCQDRLTQTLIVCLLKIYLFFIVLKIGESYPLNFTLKSKEKIGLVFRPGRTGGRGSDVWW